MVENSSLLEKTTIMKNTFIAFVIWIGLMTQWTVSLGQEINDDARFDYALQLYQQKLYLGAREEFSKIKSSRYEADIKYYVASSAVKAGQKDGENLIKEYVKNYPLHLFAKRAFYELGDYYFGKGQYDSALAYFKKSEENESDELFFKIGYCQFHLKDYKASLNSFKKLKGVNNSYEYDAAYFQGYIYYSENDFKSSYEFLKLAFNSETYKEDALVIYVSALYQMQKYQELIDLVGSELPNTKNPMIINYLADSHYALSGYRDASEKYNILLRKSKYRTETNYFKAGFSYYKIDKLEEATNYLKRAAMADDTVGAYASYYLGLIYHGQDNLPFAVTSFGNTAKYETGLKQDAIYHQSTILLETPNYQQAIEVMTSYMEQFPKGKFKLEIEEMLSIAYSHTNDYDLAMQYIENLPQLSESVKRVYQRVTFIKGMSLFNDKKFQAASEVFQKSLVYNSDPEITNQTFYWAGECMSVLKKDKDAVFYYKSVKSGDTELYIKSLYGLGYAYFNLRNYDDALVTFVKIENSPYEELDKRYLTDVLMRIADCHFALKSYEKGIDYYNKALTAGNKKIGQIYFQIGLLNRYLDRDTEAKKYFNKVINEVPKSIKQDHAHFQIAEINFKTGNENQAIKGYAELMSLHPSSPFVPFALLNQAVAYDNRGESASSIKNYQDILTRFPRHEVAKSALLALQTKNANGDFDDFEVFLAKYKAANPNSDALENIEYENARVIFYNQKYMQSVAQFEEFNKNYPNSALVIDARYFIGDAYYRLTKYDEALKNFYQLDGQRDFSKYARVLYRIAEIESELGNYKKGNQFYYKLAASGPSSRNQIFLERGLMENYLNLAKYDSVIHYGNKLLDNSRISVVIEASANLSLGKAFYYQGDTDQAVVHLLSLISNAPDENGAEANYYIGKIYFDKGQNEKSLESLFSLTNNFKGYELWVGKAFLLMSDIYTRTDEIFQAKATLNSLVENSELEEIKSEAKRKLAEIEELDETKEVNNQ